MTLAETIEAHVNTLPPQLQREALDFIAYLGARYGYFPPAGEMTTEDFIARHAGALDADFPEDIDAADLGVDAPREKL